MRFSSWFFCLLVWLGLGCAPVHVVQRLEQRLQKHQLQLAHSQSKLQRRLHQAESELQVYRELFFSFRKMSRMYFADTDVQMTQFQAHYRHLLGKLASIQHDLKRYKSTGKSDSAQGKPSLKSLWALSQKAYQEGRYKRVELLLKQTLKLYPKTLIRYDVYLLLGDSLGQRKRHFDSILWFNKARQWYRKLGNIPDKALLRLAHAHYKIKICNVAHGFLKKLLHVAPKSPYAEQARLWQSQWRTSCFADPKTY